MYVFWGSGVEKYFLTTRGGFKSFNMNHSRRANFSDSELPGKFVEKLSKHFLRCANISRNITPACLFNRLPTLNTLWYVDKLTDCRVSAYWANTRAPVSRCFKRSAQFIMLDKTRLIWAIWAGKPFWIFFHITPPLPWPLPFRWTAQINLSLSRNFPRKMEKAKTGGSNKYWPREFDRDVTSHNSRGYFRECLRESLRSGNSHSLPLPIVTPLGGTGQLPSKSRFFPAKKHFSPKDPSVFTDFSVSCRTMRGGKRGWRTCGPRWWWNFKGCTKLRRVVQRQRAPFCSRCQLLQPLRSRWAPYKYIHDILYIHDTRLHVYIYPYIHTYIYMYTYIYTINIYTQVTWSRFKWYVCIP